MMTTLRFLILLFICPFLTTAFVAVKLPAVRPTLLLHAKTPKPQGYMSPDRRKQLGLGEGEDEYDLGVALDTNTDPLITKIIAGSLIVTLLVLLVAGVVIPSLTDYGEGVCSPIQSGGRC